jgi:hypothetical protein
MGRLEETTSAPEVGSGSRRGWWISIVGFFCYTTIDAYFLLRLFTYCEDHLSSLTLFYMALLPTLLYVLVIPFVLFVRRKSWSVFATVISCLAGLAVQLTLVVVGLIPGYM